MPPATKTYKLKKGDTLVSVSRQLGLEPAALRSYHNAHCKLQDLIGPELPKYMTEILIPLQERETDVAFVQEFKEDGLLIKSHTRLRAVSHWTETCKGEEKKTEFSKDLLLNFKKQNLFYELAVTTQKADLNKDREDWLQMEAIAHIMSQIYKSIVLKISFEGELLDLLNPTEVQYHWEIAKKQLLKRNGNHPDDKITQFIIETINEEVKDRKRILHSLQYDYLYAFLLKGIRDKLYKDGYISDSTATYPYFFTYPAEKIAFTERLTGVRREGLLVHYETTAVSANKPEDEAFIGDYIASKLSHNPDIPKKMMKNLPDNLKKQLKAKKKQKEAIDGAELRFSQQGNLSVNRQTGMLHTLDYTIGASYKDDYTKEYGMQIHPLTKTEIP